METVEEMKDRQEGLIQTMAMTRWRRAAWIIIVVADAGLLAWGAMAALAPHICLAQVPRPS